MPATDFIPVPDKPGHLAAKFGKVRVTLMPKTGASGIHRGGVKVGEWPDPGYVVVIHNCLSTSAATLEAAKAIGEFYGWTENPRNMRVRPPARVHAMTVEAATAYVEGVEADRDALMARYPYTPEEVARLKASVHADVLEPTPARVIAGRIAQLSAPIPLY
jgi:hypothetical protein